MKVLVTGGAGFIGGVLVERLLAAGHEVEVLDDLSTGRREAVSPRARLHVGDVGERDVLAGVLARGFDAVAHLAALLIVDDSFDEPDRYHRVNVDATRELIDAMLEHGCRRLVFSSTAAVYGERTAAPIAETDPLAPSSPYGASKLRADELMTAATLRGLRAVSLRFFNVCGASGRLGEMRSRETHLIPLAFAAAAGHRPPLEIYGTDYPTPDRTAIRDYVHVNDVADAHLLALERMPEAGHGIFNLGSGVGRSVREVIAGIEEVTGTPLRVVERPRRRGDPPVLVADASRARRVLGWTPQASDLSRILADTHAWRERGWA
jgi:UDP-glucose 4-epimerase